ncbi:MAG TPA: biotin carboxylase N-terminal domain-containing protein [Steroidobacteraceae bacterium]|nr:biotin carboxylase N-terminal domain-containing protein [Steroidobacteraceae bacterium]
MIRRLLIANRGEIVCRIARTAKRLGVTSIAVYSDADRGARHVRCADEAYYLGESPAALSYLDIGKVIGLAKHVGADAIHPGYGFLSENAAFASACAAAHLIFVGPPAAAIHAMGSKSAAKTAMAAVGVPVAPGYHGDDQSPQRLMQEAARVGFPLIIKASAGGGGKGMQVVHSSGEMPAAIESAQRLARTAFGDDRLLLERYFAAARHVEVQIFADSHGQIVSLFDRDCSVQRRHQKIIEEAPAPGLRDEVRAAMATAAVQAARAVGYIGAGTIEFLVDESQNFYFMEMNTRLQVEHPVTEFITGIDLVEWQLSVAQGAGLPQRQSEIAQQGFAIEARLYAEDPARGYLPSVGAISHLHWPNLAAGLRLDAGVDAGDQVSTYYDPMLGKVIAHGESRAAAIDLLRGALDEIEIVGVATNRALLASVLADDEFGRGAVGTDFLAVRQSRLRFGEPDPAALDMALAAAWYATRQSGSNALWEDSRGWRLAGPASTTWTFAQRSVRIELSAPDKYVAYLGREEFSMRVLERGTQSLRVECNGQVLGVRAIDADPQLHLFRRGRHVTLRLTNTEQALQVAAGAEQGSLLTPLPGTIVAVHVANGQKVARGAPLVTVEAMKMEHTLTAPYAGVVARIAFGLADRVQAGAVLVELSALEGEEPV